MAVLALALVGPMASFGVSTHERYRATSVLPTKSAVCGLLGACLGRDYQDDQRDLHALKVHIRADQVGKVMTDFQTVSGTRRADGTANPDTFVVERQYLQDVAYLVVLEGERDLLEQVAAALKNPYFMPYLGTRCCPPGRPVFVEEVSDETPQVLMARLPRLGGEGEEVAIYLEDQRGVLTLDDQPLPDRGFTRRRIKPTRLRLIQGGSHAQVD